MEIHLVREGLRMGPFNLAQTNRGLARGELLLTDLAWHEGLPNWMPLAQVQGIVPPGAMSDPDLTSASPAGAADDAGVYAGFWIRTVAYIIDGILLSVAAALIHWIVRIILGAAGADASTIRWTSNTVSVIANFSYFTAFWSSTWQASPGQRWCGLRLITSSGENLAWLRALGRCFALLLAILPAFLGVLIIPFTTRKQGLHDFLAHTCVVKVQ